MDIYQQSTQHIQVMELEEKFAQAQQDVQQLTERPSNGALLKLYGLFKQATEGDVAGEPPSGFDFKAKFKYDAWAKLKGTAQATAMQQYIDLVESLKQGKDAS